MIRKLFLLSPLPIVLLCLPSSIALTFGTQQKQVNSEKPSAEGHVIKTRGRDSEYNGAILDDLFQGAEALNAFVLIISRLGKGEFNLKLHERRLHNVIERFTYSGSRFTKDRIVAAIGERVASKGRIEFFINGKLRFISEIDRGKDILVDCCEMSSQYYPWYRGKRRLNF